MTHYKMNRLHLGCGESLCTCYVKPEPVMNKRAKAGTKPAAGRNKTTRQARHS